MKLPNGTGTVYKLKGKRRNPWRAVITSGWQMKDGKAVQERKTLGYYPNRQEALSALMDYNRNPYDIDSKTITFAEVYEKWADVHFPSIAPASVTVWKSAFNKCSAIHSEPIRELRTFRLEEIVNSAGGISAKRRLKSLFNMVFNYALKLEAVDRNYAANIEFSTEEHAPKVIRTVFTNDEIKKIADSDVLARDFILIGIYSGWRAQELLNLTVYDVNLKEMTMKGGLKTAAGKGRIVPIHSAIAPIIERLVAAAEKRDDPRLIVDGYGRPMDYKSMRYLIWDKSLMRLDMEHLPHDMRHTFATLCKEYSVDEYVLKLLIGHAVRDLTERVYTHRQIEQLREELEKIPALF